MGFQREELAQLGKAKRRLGGVKCVASFLRRSPRPHGVAAISGDDEGEHDAIVGWGADARGYLDGFAQ